MFKNGNLSRKILISGICFIVIKLIQSLIQISLLRTGVITNKIANLTGLGYYSLSVLQYIPLIILIVYCCKALAIILNVCLILLNKNNN